MICTFTPSFWLLATSQQWFIVLEREREREAVLVAAAARAESSLPQRLFHSDPVTPPHSYSYSPTLEGIIFKMLQETARLSVCLLLHHHDHLVLHRGSHQLPASVSPLTGGVDG